MKYLVPILMFLASVSVIAETPRVVELFTSQGCSSCPSADEVLSELRYRDDAILLSWHVDYWNRLGWVDPFSDPRWTKRQERYANAFRLRSMYTPQMIIDGETQFVGSDKRKAAIALKKDAPDYAVDIKIENVNTDDEQITARIKLEGIADNIRAFAIITEDNIATESIPRGENRGRTLRHDGVVREMIELRIEDEEDISIPLGEEWITRNLKLVVITESKESMAILGATHHNLSP